VRHHRDPDGCPALRLHTVAQDDGDELLRLLILAVLAKANRPMTGEQIAEELAQLLSILFGMPLVSDAISHFLGG
jgi:hypothetical protein